MKVCMISGTFPGMKCGVGDYTYRLCVELKKLSIEPDIITSKDPNVIKDAGLSIAPVIEKWRLSALGALLDFIAVKNPGLVHLQYPTQAYKDKVMINVFPVVFRRLNPQIPLIVTVHDAKTAHPVNKLRLLPFLFAARKIVLTAEEEKAYLVKRFPSLEPKFTVIDMGSCIDVASFSERERNKTRMDLGVNPKGVLISHFGYILAKKKLEDIFYAVRRLIDKGYRIKVAMVSEFNPQKNTYHSRLDSLVKKLKLNETVVWLGYCDSIQVSRYISCSDICVEIYQDGVSFRRTSFITPLAHGVPTVTTRLNGLPRGLENYRNVVAVSVGDIEGLADAIAALIDSRELREKIGANAKIFSDRFSWANIGQKHLELYNSLI